MSESIQRPAGFVHSLERGLAVIRCFSAERPRLTLSEAARQTGLSRATVRRSLITLQTLGYVGSDERQFFLTPRVLTLGYTYISSLSVADVAQSHLTDLANEVHESCSASVLDGLDIVYVARAATKRIMTISLSVGTAGLRDLHGSRAPSRTSRRSIGCLPRHCNLCAADQPHDRRSRPAAYGSGADSDSRMVFGRPRTRRRCPVHCCSRTRCSQQGRSRREHQCSCDQGAAGDAPEILPPQAPRLRCRD